MSASLEYHRATDVSAGGTDEDEQRVIGDRPPPFKGYGDAERPSARGIGRRAAAAGRRGIVRSQERRDYGGETTMHWRAYSSAGGLFPVEAYVAAAGGLYSFDPLTPGLVRVGDGDARAAVAAAVGADADTFVVLTGIHARTGWKYMERGYRHVWWDAGTMLANLLALASADGLEPRLYVGFVDRELNRVLGADGRSECSLAVIGLEGRGGVSYPLAEAAQAASELDDLESVQAWRSPSAGSEPNLPRNELVGAFRRRSSVRRYGTDPLPREEVAELLGWSEAPIPADAPSVVRQLVTVAAVEGLRPGVYDAELNLVREWGAGRPTRRGRVRRNGAGSSEGRRDQRVANGRLAGGGRAARRARLPLGPARGRHPRRSPTDRRLHARLGRGRVDLLRRGGLEAARHGGSPAADGRDRPARERLAPDPPPREGREFRPPPAASVTVQRRRSGHETAPEASEFSAA